MAVNTSGHTDRSKSPPLATVVGTAKSWSVRRERKKKETQRSRERKREK